MAIGVTTKSKSIPPTDYTDEDYLAIFNVLTKFTENYTRPLNNASAVRQLIRIIEKKSESLKGRELLIFFFK